MAEFKIFLCCFFLISYALASLADLPPELKSLVINEINLISPAQVPDQYIEIHGEKNIKLNNVYLVFFDRYGNTYYNLSLNNITSSNDGLAIVGNLHRPAGWSLGEIKTDLAAVALYYLEDRKIPLNVEIDNRNHVLLDGVVYKGSTTNVSFDIPQVLRQLMTGSLLTESVDYSTCYFPNESVCDRSLSRCKNATRNADSFVNGPLTPDKPNQCPLPYFVINEFRVNAFNHSGYEQEFLEIRTSNPSGIAERKSLDNVYLVGLSESDFKEGTSLVMPSFHISLNNYSLGSTGYFSIGDAALKCPLPGPTPCINLPTKDKNFLLDGTYGMALLWGPMDFPTTQDAIRLRLIDSVAYTMIDAVNFPNQMTKALNLEKQDILFINSSTAFNESDVIIHVISLAREPCCQVSDMSAFEFADPTPAASNDGHYLGNATVYFSPSKQALLNARINEVGLTVTREHDFIAFYPGGSDVTVNFVEVWAPNRFEKLNGLVAVVYSGESDSMNYGAMLTCDCTGVTVNEYNLGVCPCPTNQAFNNTVSSLIAVVLHLGTPSEFQNIGAWEGKDKPHVDSIVAKPSFITTAQYVLQNDIFAVGQAYNIPTPKFHQFLSLKYSISRCFGDYATTAGWLASFAVSYNVTQGQKNICPRPDLQIAQVYINDSVTPADIQLELTAVIVNDDIGKKAGKSPTAGAGLPLDRGTLAVAQEVTEGEAEIVASFSLVGLFADQGCKTLTIKSSETFTFNTTKPSALIIYWDISPKKGEPANSTGILFSLILDAEQPVPKSLLALGSTVLDADSTGICSLTNGDCNEWVYAKPSIGDCQMNKCTPCSKGGITTTEGPTTTTRTRKPTTPKPPSPESVNSSLFINEIYYNYETTYSYIEIVSTRFGLPALDPPVSTYYLVLYNSTLDSVTIKLPDINFVQIRQLMFGFTDKPNATNFGQDFSQMQLVPNGPGAVCLHYNYIVRVIVDCVVYTTNASNTEGLANLTETFNSPVYAIEAKDKPHYQSISRCAPGANATARAFVNTAPTVDKKNQCPSLPDESCVAIQKKSNFNCFVDGGLVGQTVLNTLVAASIKQCDCGLNMANLNFGGKLGVNLSRSLWSCNDDGNLEIRSTVWCVDQNQSKTFHEIFNSSVPNKWLSLIVSIPGEGVQEILYGTCYYQNKPYPPGINILLITCIVVAAIAVVATLIASICLCWRICFGNGHQNHWQSGNVIVPMHARKIDKSSMELLPASDLQMQDGRHVPLATTSASQAHMISAKRWSPPERDYAEAVLETHEQPRVFSERL